MISQPYHHGNLRAELLTAGQRALNAEGVAGLSLRALARELGVSHAAPGRHFADRRALLDALAVEGFAQLDRAMTGAIDPAADTHARLVALGTAYVEFAVANAPLLGLMYAHKHEADASAELVAAGQGALDLATRLVAEGQAAGELAPGDPERIATVAFATVHGVATLAAGGLLNDVPAAEIAIDAIETLWRGSRVVKESTTR